MSIKLLLFGLTCNISIKHNCFDEVLSLFWMVYRDCLWCKINNKTKQQAITFLAVTFVIDQMDRVQRHFAQTETLKGNTNGLWENESKGEGGSWWTLSKISTAVLSCPQHGSNLRLFSGGQSIYTVSKQIFITSSYTMCQLGISLYILTWLMLYLGLRRIKIIYCL